MPSTNRVLKSEYLFEQMQGALAETEQLFEIGFQLNEATTLDEVLQAASLPGISAEAASASLIVFDVDGEGRPQLARLVANWVRQGTAPWPLGAQFQVSELPFAAEWRREPSQPLLIGVVAAAPGLDAASRAFLEPARAQALAIMPLALQDRWVGLIIIAWDQPHSFAEADQRVFKLAAAQAAVSVDNRLLFEQVQEQLEQAQKRAAELETVAQVSIAASTILQVEKLLQTVVDLTKIRFDLYHAQIYLLDDARRSLVLTVGAGEAGRQMVARRLVIPLDWGHSLVARAARAREAVIVNDVRETPDFLPNRLLPETRSEMAVPMIASGEVLGVIDVQSKQADRFTRADIQAQTILATQVAVALEKARRFEKEQQTARELREMDRLKSEFLANMSHELRTPLNSIIGFSEILLEGLDGELSDNASADIKAIHTSGKHLLALINDILDLAKIEAGRMTIHPELVSVKELMAAVRATASILVKDRPIDLIIPNFEHLPPVKVDAVRINQIILNLISNAVKFTERGHVAVDVRQEGNEMIFSVSDTGLGISAQNLEYIFERFRQLDGSSTRRAGGTGLGLTITRHLVEMHGGQIWVDSREGAGSTFSFSIPLEEEVVG